MGVRVRVSEEGFVSEESAKGKKNELKKKRKLLEHTRKKGWCFKKGFSYFGGRLDRYNKLRIVYVEARTREKARIRRIVVWKELQ